MDLYKFYAESVNKILTSKENFIKFNETAGRVYRYPFHDQILIYAQKPEATAVADRNVWIKKMNCHFKNNAIAIALADRTDSEYQLRFVYDVSDVEKDVDRNGNVIGKDVPLWKITPENEHIIFPELQGDLNKRIMASVFNTITEDVCIEVCDSIERIGYKADYNTIRTTLIAMSLIQVMSRCKLNSDIYKGMPIDINAITPTVFMCAGEKASEISENILRSIYRSIIEYNKSLQKEKKDDNIQRGKGNNDTHDRNNTISNDEDNDSKGKILKREYENGIRISPDDGEDREGTVDSGGNGERIKTNNRDRRSDTGDNITPNSSDDIKKETKSKEIKDFGEHIGGARKELYGSYLNFEDLNNMNLEEQLKTATKNKIWPKKDWEKEIENGLDPAIAYFHNEIRKLFPAKPKFKTTTSADDKIRIIHKYVEACCILRDYLMQCDTREKCEALKDKIFSKDGLFPIEQDKGYIRVRHYGIPGVFMDNDSIIPDKLFYMTDFTSGFLSRGNSWGRMESQLKKELFGIPENKKLFTQIINDSVIIKNTEGTLTLEPGYSSSGRIVFGIKTGSGKHFIYPDNKGYFERNPELKDINNYKKDTFMVLGFIEGNRSEPFILPNFNTKEEAEIALKEFAGNLQNEVNNIREEKKQKEKEEKENNITPRTRRTAPVRNVIREGCPDVRNGKEITGDDYLQDFHFRGGEFGNWNSNKERQDCLNAGYEACMDLAKALNISPESISLGGDLAIAFGARGKGRALAHFESLRNVINLTKMKGAGSLAHEWGHAFDAYLGKRFNVQNPEFSCFATEATRETRDNLPECIKEIVDVMQTRISTAEERLDLLKEDIKKDTYYAFRLLEGNDGKMLLDKVMEDPEKTKQFDILINNFITNKDNPEVPLMAFYSYKEHGNNRIKYGGDYEPITNLKNEFIKLCGENPEDYIVDYTEESDYNLGKLAETYKKYQYLEKNPKDIKVKSEYYENALTQRNPKYYASPTEMFARAFSLYVSEKLNENGMKDTYLTRDKSNNEDPLIPHGKEKEAIFTKFDEIIEYCKENSLLLSEEKNQEKEM